MVRAAGRIPAADFPTRLVKWVRYDHIRTTAAWRHRDDFEVNGFS